MELNFDNLKQALKQPLQREESQCELTCNEGSQGEEGSFIDVVQKYMLAPARCGVYYSRLDMKVIGLRFGEDVQVRQRAWMLRDILRAVTSKGELEELFAIIKEVGGEKVAVYDELASHFPHAAPLFQKHKERFEGFCQELDRIVEEMEE
ncbi:MAG: hypothetical protein C6I00_04830 [Nitratiruptor sp.]|nr:hypothetical protein [Nitratiruptor sp.]NPA84234.1 hypothetical protein [Campylobacterota bacterium]